MSLLWNNNFGHSTVGFKIFPVYQSPSALELIIADTKIKKIILTRQNCLRMYVSFLIAAKSQDWRNSGDRRALESKKVSVDISSFNDFVAKNDQIITTVRKQLQSSHQSVLELTYENLVMGLENRRLLDYFALPAFEMQSSIEQQNPYPLADLVINYEELCYGLSNTKFEADLD